MRLVAVVALALCSLLSLGCNRAGPKGPEARKLVASGAMLVDVRTPREFAEGHISGAVNIPLDQLGERLSELGAKDGQIVVYCRSGARSTRAEQLLRENGYENVLNLGPMSAW